MGASNCQKLSYTPSCQWKTSRGLTYLLASACGDIYEAIEKAAENQFGPEGKVVEHADGTIGLLGAHFPDSKSLKLKGEVDFVIMDFSAVLKGEKDE